MPIRTTAHIRHGAHVRRSPLPIFTRNHAPELLLLCRRRVEQTIHDSPSLSPAARALAPCLQHAFTSSILFLFPFPTNQEEDCHKKENETRDVGRGVHHRGV
jgi:hypothetical protein